MSNPSKLLPLTFGNTFSIRSLTWEDFCGDIDEKMPWSAHIYWSIDFKIVDYQRKKVTVNLNISKNSWVRQQRKSHHLLNHEQGHYLIGSLCCLEFLRRIDSKKKHSVEKFEDLVNKTFNRTLGEFLELERQYDNETQHRLNYKMQEKWDKYITEKLNFYLQIFDKKKGRFVKFTEIPLKNK